MAEAPESEPMASSSEGAVRLDVKDADEPLTKKRKITDKEGSDKLEHRLGGILCCAVCLDLPPAAVYQCSNGHLMCAPCFMHLLADARLRDDAATCPNCRVEISSASASRNLAVEKTVSELPSDCKFCARAFPRHALRQHEESACDDRKFKFSQIVVDPSPDRRYYLDSLVRIVSCVYRLLQRVLRRSGPPPAPAPRPGGGGRVRRLTGCRYACLGCGWRGPAHESGAHEAACALPRRAAADVLAVLAERERRAQDAGAVYNQVLDLLSYEKITFNDLQLKPYRTEEFVHKLYYETSRFAAHGHTWVVKAFVNNNQRDPTQSTQREISYQLIMKSKTPAALGMQWLVLRGPYGQARMRPRVGAHVFADDAPAAAPLALPLADDADTNRLLSHKAIHFRLIMFLSLK